MEPILAAVVENYKNFYPELKEEMILPIFQEENSRFLKNGSGGIKGVE